MESSARPSDATAEELVEALEGVLLELIGEEPPSSAEPLLKLAERVGRVLDLSHGLLSLLAARVDATGAHKVLGHPSTSAWLKARLGMRKGRAQEIVTTARQLPRLSQVAERLLSGRLSWGQAAVIADSLERVPSGEDTEAGERILLDLADSGALPDETAKAGRIVKDLIDDRLGRPPEDTRRGYERSWLRMSRSLCGGAYLRGWFKPEDAASLQETLAPLLRSRTPEDDRDQAQRTADALTSCLTRGHRNAGLTLIIDLASYTARTGSPHPFGPHSPTTAALSPNAPEPQPSFTASETVPEVVRHRPAVRLLDGTELPVEDARRIALSAGFHTLIVGGDGVPLYLGRRQRLASAGQRRALEALYETCCVKGCTVPATLCEIHHLNGGWNAAAPTDITHLAPACRWHNSFFAARPAQCREHHDPRGRTIIEIRVPWEELPRPPVRRAA